MRFIPSYRRGDVWSSFFIVILSLLLLFIVIIFLADPFGSDSSYLSYLGLIPQAGEQFNVSLPGCLRKIKYFLKK